MILVTGATGKTGLGVIRAAANKGFKIRAFVHNEEKASFVRQVGITEAVFGNLLDPISLSKAIKGIEAIYLICPNVHPMESEMVRNLIEVAKTAHVNRVIYHSVLFPQIEAMPHHWNKMRAEELLIQSGLEFTILQPASYMQNVLPYWDAVKQGEYRAPYSVNSIFSPVDLEDVAEVACQVLMRPGHASAIYQLAGPERLSSKQMVEKISTVLGKSVSAHTQPLDEWISEANKRGMDGYAIMALSKMFSFYDQYGFATSGLILQDLLGHPSTTFSQFLNRLIKQTPPSQ